MKEEEDASNIPFRQHLICMIMMMMRMCDFIMLNFLNEKWKMMSCLLNSSDASREPDHHRLGDGRATRMLSQA